MARSVPKGEAAGSSPGHGSERGALRPRRGFVRAGFAALPELLRAGMGPAQVRSARFGAVLALFWRGFGAGFGTVRQSPARPGKTRPPAPQRAAAPPEKHRNKAVLLRLPAPPARGLRPVKFGIFSGGEIWE